MSIPLREINHNATLPNSTIIEMGPSNQGDSTLPTYVDSLPSSSNLTSISLRDTAPIIIIHQYPNTRDGNSNANSQSNPNSNDNTSQPYLRASMDSERENEEVSEEESERDEFITQVLYEIQPAPSTESICSLPGIMFILGCCFPPFWLIGSAFVFKTQPETLARAYSFICIFLTLLFASFLVTACSNLFLNPDKSASFFRDIMIWQ